MVLASKGRKIYARCKKCRGVLCFHEKLEGKAPVLNPMLVDTDICIEVLRKLVETENKSDEEILRKAKNEISVDPLCFAAAAGHLKGATKLVQAGADPNRSFHGGVTPLMLATRNRHQDVVEMLLRQGAMVQQADFEGFNTLMLGILTGDAKLVNLLWPSRGNLDINHANHTGHTALHLAADKCWETCVHFLLSNGAIPDIQTRKTGWTALIISAMKGDMKTTEKLVTGGANILIEDNDGFTAICWAYDKGRVEIVRYLLSQLPTQDKQNSFVKSRLERMRKIGKDVEMERTMNELLIPLLQMVSKIESYREVLLRQKLVSYVLSLAQKYLKNEDIVSEICHLLCLCMYNSDTMIDERFAQQFIRCRGPEFCMRVMKVFSGTTKRDNELLIACLFPISCITEVKEGKEWIKKNSSKLSVYSYLTEEYDSIKYPDDILKEKGGILWRKFWALFVNVECAERDLKMQELLDEEERERTRKEKKRDKKRQKRQQRSQTKTNVEKNAEKEVDEQVQSQVEAEMMMMNTATSAKQIIKNKTTLLTGLSAPCDEIYQESPTWTKVTGKKSQTKQLPGKEHARPDSSNKGVAYNKNTSEAYMDEERCVRGDENKGLDAYSDVNRKSPIMKQVYEEEFPSLTPVKPRDRGNCVDTDMDGKSPTQSESRTSTPETDTSKWNIWKSESHSNSDGIWDSEDDNIPMSDSYETCEEERPMWRNVSPSDVKKRNDNSLEVWQSTQDFEEKIRNDIQGNISQEGENNHMRTSMMANTFCNDNLRENKIVNQDIEDHFMNMKCYNTYDKTEIMEDKNTTSFCKPIINNNDKNQSKFLTLKDVAGTLISNGNDETQDLIHKTTINKTQSMEPQQISKEKGTSSERVVQSGEKNKGRQTADTTTMSISEKGITLEGVEAGFFQSSGSTPSLSQKSPFKYASTSELAPNVAVIEPIGHRKKLNDNIMNPTPNSYNDSMTSQVQSVTKCREKQSWSAGIGKQIKETERLRRNKATANSISLVENGGQSLHEIKCIGPPSGLIAEKSNPPSNSSVRGTSALPETKRYTKQGNCELGESILHNAINIPYPREEFAFFNKTDEKKTLPHFPSLHDDKIPKELNQDELHTMKTIQDVQITSLQTYFSNDAPYTDRQYYVCAAGLDPEAFSRDQSGVKPNILDNGSMYAPDHSDIEFLQPSIYTDEVVYKPNKKCQQLDIQDDPSHDEEHDRISNKNPLQNSSSQNFKDTFVKTVSTKFVKIPSENEMKISQLITNVGKGSNVDNISPGLQAMIHLNNITKGYIFNLICGTSHCVDLKPPTKRMWTPCSKRWNKKLSDIWNLPPHHRRIVGSIVLPLDRTKYQVPYSDSSATLGFLVDGTEVAVVEVSMTLADSGFLDQLISPQCNIYFLAKYKAYAIENYTCYLAMKLFEYTLEEFIRSPTLADDNISGDDDQHITKWTWQILKGLCAVHEHYKQSHGNLMPSNILIDVEGRIQLSEYCFPVTLPQDQGFLGRQRIGEDRSCWLPIEICTETGQFTMQSDMQVLAMLLHYLATRGTHPFGENSLEISVCIQQNWAQIHTRNDEVNDLVAGLMVMPPSQRPTASDTLKHPYFWANEKKLRLVLIAGSDVLRDMKLGVSTNSDGGSTMIDIINSGGNGHFLQWTSEVDSAVMREMRTFRQYKNTLVELVLFVYNCCLHFEKLSDVVRDIIDEPCRYFLQKFPKLCISVYKAIQKTERVHKLCYKPFY